MRLDRMLDRVDVRDLTGDPSGVEVSSITEDDRQVVAGTLFCCVVGQRVDGHTLAETAVGSGAVALLCERRLPLTVPQVVVPSVRPAMAWAAAELYGRPSDRMSVIGVTGTNGKTTVTHMVQALLGAEGQEVAVLGTLSGARTTPSAPVLQQVLAEELSRGRKAVAMEVSSHALVQHRVDAIDFAAGVFTNLSRDHLDYHGTMDAYFEAKARLFIPGRCRRAVVNVGDPWGRRLAERVEDELHPFSADDATDLVLTLSGSEFLWRGRRVRVPLPGGFNVLNALAAATTATSLGVPEAVVAEGLAQLRPIPGRLQPVEAGQPFRVLVDFAHTPDGLEQLLGSVRMLLPPAARLAVVFGCGGERDPGKRPLMGEIAARLSDMAVVTSDNPRSEDPGRIIDEILAGVSDVSRVRVEQDRRAAIAAAFDWAGPGDVVLLAGKGHETGQEVAGVVHPFDDVEVARELLAGVSR